MSLPITSATLFLVLVPALQAQSTAILDGRIVDESTGEAVADAIVVLEGTGQGTLTNQVGVFEFPEVPAGDMVVRVRHIAYGDFQGTVTLEPDTRVSLRITLSPTAIAIDPVVVEVQSRATLEERARGTQSNVVTREQVEVAIRSSQQLAQLLERNIPGTVVRQGQGRAGIDICLEFRAPRSLQDPLSCKTPRVFIDGVNVANPRFLWGTFPLEDIERVEIVPSVEAGARYGTESNYGVVLIETRTGRSVMGAEGAEPAVTEGGTYDWTLESQPYPRARVFVASFLGNAVGFTAGAVVAGQCLDFDGLSNAVFNSSCGGVATLGATTALYALPLTGSTLATRRAGRTDLSRGRAIPTAIAGALALVPGTLLVAAAEGEAFSGATAIGWVTIAVGVPLFTTLADRLFRSIHGDPIRAVEEFRP